nr:hypothetical protein [Aquicoccus sp. G2-2]MEA1114292.1 hypothetical protein [Aquicoccus sp. G2-2]
MQRIHRWGKIQFWHQSFNMSTCPIMAFCGNPLSLRHLLKGELLRRMSGALALQPSATSHRPRFGPVIDPNVTQHRGRNELAFGPLILGGTFSGPAQITRRLVRFIGNPDQRQFSCMQ